MKGISLNLVIITGFSGAGKTQALQSMEDLGFFCVDNLPPTLIEKFVDLCAQSQGKIDKAAIVCDLRVGDFFSSLNQALNDLESAGYKYEILFLEASDDVLVNRYKESRRRHPVSPKGNVLEGIHKEREFLADLRGKANKIIDSSDLTVSQMKEKIRNLFGKDYDPARMSVSVVSFGFKYGIPLDADTIIDVRFLPNPYYLEELKPMNGKDTPVRDFVLSNPTTEEFIKRFFAMLEYILPLYLKEGKSHLVIGIGCTGGQHRSVAVTEKTAEFLRTHHYSCVVNHRDIQ
ncbi:RNase adapter RapZ [Dehalobacter sp. DCM]|uniref:RNase adapter RapZ n=1 Tax=Dehalobacter sp. DCM TaxID=2907827 RepID=UPI003081A94E|nr:RNase adapter RapZ [Dehalobacter sp. DCM]